MNKWKCMIVDDEPVAVRVLRRHLEKLNHFEVVMASHNAMEAFEYLGKHPIDLILLDIEMPELGGMELLRSLDEAPAVIFVTAHRDFAVEGFELNAVDYLVKPVSFSRLLKALQRFEQQSARAPARPAEGGDSIYVTVDRKKRRINLDEVLYIEGLKDYVRICTAGEKIITRETMTQMQQRLPSNRFLRIHRSFIINRAKIETVSYDEISLEKETLPVGRTYRDEVMRRLNIG